MSKGDENNEEEVEEDIQEDVLGLFDIISKKKQMEVAVLEGGRSVRLTAGEEEQKRYDDKICEMKKYLPTLESLRQKCSKEGVGSNSAGLCVKKLTLLYEIFDNPKKRLTFPTLLRCEKILENLSRKLKITGLSEPELKSKQSTVVTKNLLSPKKQFKKIIPSEKVVKPDSHSKKPHFSNNRNSSDKGSFEITKKTSEYRDVKTAKSSQFSDSKKGNDYREIASKKATSTTTTVTHSRKRESTEDYEHTRKKKAPSISPFYEEDPNYKWERKIYMKKDSNDQTVQDISRPEESKHRQRLHSKKKPKVKPPKPYIPVQPPSRPPTVPVMPPTVSVRPPTVPVRPLWNPEFPGVSGKSSPEVRLDNLKGSQNDERDSDMITLKNSQRKLEALMQNRLAAMNASKMSVTIKKDSSKSSIIPSSECKASSIQNSEFAMDNISSTFDEMMSNLHSKFRLGRSQLAESQPKIEASTDNNKLIDRSKKVDNCHSQSKISLDDVRSNELPHAMSQNVQPPPLCSILSSQNKTVPFLEDDTICSESNVMNIHNSKKYSSSTLNVPIQVTSVELGASSYEKSSLLKSDQYVKETVGKTVSVHETKDHFYNAKDPSIMMQQEINTSQNLNSGTEKLTEETTSTIEKVSEVIQAKLGIKNVGFSQPSLPNEQTNLTMDSASTNTEDRSILKDKMYPVSEKPTFQTPSKKQEEIERCNQSVRSKLSEEITTLHKVGGSSPGGGVLRGLINREKMMPPGRIASLKPGTLFDLIQEEKPQRSIIHKQKSRPHSQQILNVENNRITANCSKEINQQSTQNDTNYILSKLSENDLKKLITENIGDLPTPPMIPFLNNSITSTNLYGNEYCEMPVSQLSTWNHNPTHQMNLNAQNVIINNICVAPTENNRFLNSSAQIQNPLNNLWMPNQRNDSWMNNMCPPKGPIMDQQSDLHHQEFEQPAYSNTQSFSNHEGKIEESFKTSSYNPVVLQTDPFRSPCYDGTNTPDPYRTDPYTVNIQGNKEPLSINTRPSLLGSPPVMSPIQNTNQRPALSTPPLPTNIMQRPPLLPTPPLPTANAMQSPTLLNKPFLTTSNYTQRSSILGAPSNYDRNVNQNTLLLEEHMVRDRDANKFYPENQLESSRRKVERKTFGDTAYDSWRLSNNISENNFNHSPTDDTNECFDRIMSDRRNQNYRWSSYDRGRFDHAANSYENNKYYQDNISTPVALQNDSNFKKLSARDPRRKSIEEKNTNNNNFNSKSSICRSEQVVNYRRDPRIREKTPPRVRARSRERIYSKERSSSRGRSRTPTRERSVVREQEENRKSNVRHSQDTYSSPLQSLYNNSMTPKTGLGYGFQKFRIPKINKTKSDHCSTKTGSNVEKPALIDTEHKKDSTTVKKDETTEINSIEKSSKDEEVIQSDMHILKEVDNDKFKENKSSPKRRSTRLGNKNAAEHVIEVCTQDISVIPKEKGINQEVVEKSFEATEDTDSKDNSSKRETIENDFSAIEPSVDKPPEKEEQIDSKVEDLQEPINRVSDLLDTDKIQQEQSLLVSPNIEKERTTCNKKVQKKDLSEKSDNTNCKGSLSSKHKEDMFESENNGAIDLSLKKSTESSVSGEESGLLHSNAERVKITQEAVLCKSDNMNETNAEHEDNSDLRPELATIQKKLGIQITADILKLLAEIVKKDKGEATIADQIKSVGDQCLHSSSADKTNTLENTDEGCNKVQNKDDTNIVQKQELETTVTQSESYSVNEKQTNNAKGKGSKLKKRSKVNIENSNSNDQEKQKTNKTQKRKYKNELDRLQDDISKYHDSEAIAAASGLRLCRLQKEKLQGGTTATPPSNVHSQQNNNRKNISKKTIKVEEEEEEDDDAKSDADSSDSDPLFRLSERLKSKYQLNTENQEKIRKEQLLKEEARNAASSERNVLCPETNERSDNPVSKLNLITTPKDDHGGCKQRYTADNKTSDSKVHETTFEKIEEKASIDVKQVGITLIPLDESITNQHQNRPNSLPSSEDSAFHDDSSEVVQSTINEEKGTNSLTSKAISNNIIRKYRIKKQKKKCFWNLGIIKKKNKFKKVEKSFSFNEDVEASATSLLDDFEELIIPEPPDKNYFQDIDIKCYDCKLCSFKGHQIVTHYSINHPKDEVLISRLSPKAAEEAITESKIFFNIKEEKRKQITSYKCRVCLVRFKKFTMFFEHVALHTGEYRHECCCCGYRTSTQSGIYKHCREKHNMKNPSNISQRVLYKEPKNRTFVCGYLCLLCNFFQINQINVKRHVENNHANEGSSNHIFKINMGKVPLERLKSNDHEIEEPINENATEKDSNLYDKESINLDKEVSLQSQNSVDNARPKTTNETILGNSTSMSVDEECNAIKSGNVDTIKEAVPTLSETLNQNQKSNIHTDDFRFTKENNELLESSHKPKVDIIQQVVIKREPSVENDSNNESTPISENNVEADEDDLKQIEESTPPSGCFEPSPNLENHVQSIEAEVRNLYMEKCVEAVANISKNINQCNGKTIVEALEKKQHSESNTTTACNLEELIKIKWKNKRVSSEITESENTCLENSADVTPTRRQLPERTCKSVVKSKSISDDSDYNVDEDCFEDLFKEIDEPDNGCDSEDSLEETPPSINSENSTYSAPFLFSNLIEQCKVAIYSSKLSYFPKTAKYKSCLPPKTDLTEFSYMMKHIRRYYLKSEEDRQIRVGDLQVNLIEKKFVFTCCICDCDKNCGFETKAVDVFGEHLQASHHLAPWEGFCLPCYTLFIQDKSSHDSESIYSQTKAFCHLVKEHLKFSRTPEEPTPTAQCSTSTDGGTHEGPVKPLLRVRRLSGDKLSTRSGENSNASQSQREEGPSNDTPRPSSANIGNISSGDEDSDELLGFPRKILSALKYEHVPDYHSLTSAAVYKTEESYKAMCTPTKLRHFYKCMGSYCSFTTSCPKTFASHSEQHYQVSSSTLAINELSCNWDVCSYCFTTHNTSMDLCIHIKKDHGNCSLQCAYCFYRAHSIANVHFHHTIEHPKEKFCVLECKEEPNQHPIGEKPFIDVVIPLRCTQEGCQLFTYMLNSFCYHLYNVHMRLQCHLCSKWKSSAKLLLKHYKNCHSIGIYQCLYCLFGAFTERQIRTHLCYKHSNSAPRAIHRPGSLGRQKFVPQSQESLRRIVFNKDHDKLLQFVVPFPQEEMSGGGNCSPSLETNANLSSPTRPVMFRGILSGTTTVSPRQLKFDNPVSTPVPNSTSSLKKSNDSTGTVVSSVSSPIRIRSFSVTPTFVKIVPKSSASAVRSPIISPAPTASNKLNPLMTANSSAEMLVVRSSPSPTVSTPAAILITVAPTQPHTSSVLTSALVAAKPTVSTSTVLLVTTPSTQPSTSSVITCPLVASKLTVSDSADSMEVDVPSNNSDISEHTLENQGLEEEVNYFRCGNNGCDFGASSSGQLRSHLVICDYARQTERLKCVFCFRLFKQANSLVSHLQCHGPDRFECSLCHLKGPMQARMVAHMKIAHNVCNTDLIPVNILKQDLEKHHFRITPKNNGNISKLKPSSALSFGSSEAENNEKRNRGCEKSGSKVTKLNTFKTKFSPKELEEIPTAAIFYYPLGCSLCTYETKVRSNLLRHMALHAQGDSVSQEEVVNPVPNKTEKMFDKMMNLAGSSHKKKNTEDGTETEIACPYKYVPDQLRYMCHLMECGYRTLSETMLRDHVSVIHKEETSYICPHCPEIDNIVPIDQLGLHLKLHDSPLFKCSYCDFYGHIRRSIEKHQSIYHSELEVSVQVIRMIKPDLVNPDKSQLRPLPAGLPEEQGEKWYMCDLCRFKTKKKKVMLSHGITEHQKNKPFRCSICQYESATDTIFKNHFKTHHQDSESCKVVTFYKMVTEAKASVLPPILPLWKRDPKKIKLIRGITIDEKGDAPPPVATCVSLDMSSVDRTQLKFGLHGSATPSGCFVCPRCSTFQTKSRYDFREHLYKHFEYKPLACSMCDMTSTQKSKIIKHITKIHNIEMDQEKKIKINLDEDLEKWVEITINKQLDQMKESVQDEEMDIAPVISKKRRRSSLDIPSEYTVETSTPVPSPITATDLSELDSSFSINDLDLSQFTLKDTDCSQETERSSLDEIPSSSGDTPEKIKKKRDKSPSRHRFRCCYCKLTAKFKSSLSGHSKKMHPNLPVQIIPMTMPSISEISDGFICMYCNCLALNQDNLKNHWSSTHKGSNLEFKYRKVSVQSDLEYQCFWCGEHKDIHSLEDHCKKHHPNQRFLVVTVTVSKYKCSECSLVLNSVDILKRHFSMEHSTKPFSYIVVTTPKHINSPNRAPTSVMDSLTIQEKTTKLYKCSTCNYTSNTYLSLVKHIKKHFVTFLCSECEAVFKSPLAVRSHMCSNHPGSSSKSVVLKGSIYDIENAKKSIVIILGSGKKRIITDQEIAEGEKEYFLQLNTEMYSYDELLEDTNISLPKLKETARKSTGSTKQHSARMSLQMTKNREESLEVYETEPGPSNVFLNFKSNGKDIKLPMEISQKLFDLDVRFSTDHDKSHQT